MEDTLLGSQKNISSNWFFRYWKNLWAGRMNRKTYFVGTIILYYIIILLYYSPYIWVKKVYEIPTFLLWFYFIGIGIALVFLSVWSLSLAVKRFHDVNHSLASLLLLIIPVIGTYYGFWLFFKKGIQEKNTYGTNPKPGVNIQAILGFSTRATFFLVLGLTALPILITVYSIISMPLG